MSPEHRELFADEPVEHVQRDGVDYALLGTAHVSRTSAEAVERLLDSGHYDAVAIELCPSRHQALSDQNRWRNLNLFQVLREGKAGMMMASLALSAYQRRIAEQFGIEPGAEMKAAMEAAKRHGLPVQLIDREIGTTLRRASRRLGWWKRWVMVNGLVFSLFSREEISEEDVEKLKEGDLLTQTFSEFSEASPELFEVLIAERDRYMAARLRQENADGKHRRVLAVLGAGHLAGTSKALADEQAPPADVTVGELEQMPPPSKLFKILPWVILVAVVTGFAIGFSRSPELGWSLIATWVVINGGLSALGALLARAHPLTILTALIAAPLTSLNPTVGAGMVSGAVEAWLRKPRVGDFEKLRDDVTSIGGWFRNRVSHVFVVFFLSNLGSAIGTWVAGFRMVQQLM
ncbi:TraB/GumN family protein [Wenzhouxiangella marina]|uniref:TraB family protein n=1 Tax=Wenzhouxiangella marina TaxID=1579979 RepID=A0A0K0XW86_9GAMM|nr:TraB/GumN family protein [Wenzhouxiangella marina]AKS41881.1 TraB family protein [Wenzhouxiangella marina]MBB6086353.1 pheromone shutdown-related protein TraB [Wenzhouxiangella marina]